MNGKERNLSQFRKLSAYIMQDNQLHGNLTVEEAMTVATNLKLSTKVDKNGKIDVVSRFGFFISIQIWFPVENVPIKDEGSDIHCKLCLAHK